MASERTDRELLEAWQEGDAASGDELFGRHFIGLYRFFRNKVDGPVDDLVQRTFLGCAESRERFRRGCTFRTFAFTIARNVLFDHLRSRYREASTGDLGSRSVIDLGTTPSQLVARKAEHRLLLHALRRLRLDYQIALELSFWDGLSGPEIGEVLGVPEATARTWLRRAKIELAEAMTKLAEAEGVPPSTVDSLAKWADGVRAQLEPSNL